jgi:CRP-like cAMP-binding protein
MALVSKIVQLSKLSKEAENFLTNSIESFHFKKNETVLQQHSICNYLYYVKSGILGSYYHTEEKEVCNWIAAENDFATSYYSFISRKSSFEIIECYEDTELQAISYSKVQEMYSLFPETERAGRLIFEEYYLRLEERLLSIQFKSAKERYDLLMKRSPQFILRAPLGRIASYLGMSQETLSRIRSGK